MVALTGIRKIGVVATALLVVLLAGTQGQAQSPPGPPAAGVSKLRILYAGHAGSHREKDFVAFLTKYFDVIRTGDLATFQEADTQGFDVTILDYDAEAFSAPCPTFSPRFSKPLITVGMAGGSMGRRWRLKTAYL
jgi:hypothetical protein